MRPASPRLADIFRSRPYASTAAGTTLLTELYDVEGRLVDATTIPCEGTAGDETALPVKLATKRCIDEGGRVVGRLVVDGEPVDMMRRRVIISTPFDPDEFYLSGWWSGFGGYYLREERMKRLREAGFKIATMRPVEGDEDIGYWRRRGWKIIRNYVIWPRDTKIKAGASPGPIRTPCWADPKIIDTFTRGFIGRIHQANQYGGALDYGAGDEILIGDKVCFCPHCLKNFRDLLRAEYLGVSELNAEWGTSHASFDEILPDTVEKAHGRGNYASWLLWRQSMEASLTSFYREATAAMQKVDPQARIHSSGTMGDLIKNGVDYWNVSKIINFKGYNEWWLVGELLRSFQTTRNHPYAYSWGHMWLSVLQGAYDGCGTWCMARVEIAPDLTLRTQGINKKLFMDKVARPGLTRLMKNSVRDNTRVALHYSRLSRFAAKAMDPVRGEHLRWEHNVECWSIMLNTLGLQSDMVSFHELEAGRLTPDKYDVLILPTSHALRPGEAEAIERYVGAGGAVIADGRLGEFDQHLIRNKTRALDDVFGIVTSDEPKPLAATVGRGKRRWRSSTPPASLPVRRSCSMRPSRWPSSTGMAKARRSISTSSFECT